MEWNGRGGYNIKTQSVIPVVTADLLENHALTPPPTVYLHPSLPSTPTHPELHNKARGGKYKVEIRKGEKLPN
jgi:hypothetical protein